MQARAAFIRVLCAAALVAAALGILRPHPARAASLVVNSSADNATANNNLCTLREAINNANANSDTTSGDCTAGSGADTITFAAGLSGATITLGSNLPALAGNLTINGSSLASPLSINGQDLYQVFIVNSGVSFSLTRLTVRDGKGTNSAGAIRNDGGTVAVSRVTFTSNSAISFGGAIYSANLGTVTVSESTFNGNTAASSGGAVYALNGTFTVIKSTFSGNSAEGGGGLLNNNAAVTVTNSTFSGNSATSGSGGGIYNAATLTVRNSTFSGNSATSSGGGILSQAASTLHLANSIIADSTGSSDCFANFGLNTNNLVEDGSCPVSLTGDPMLGPLADNGGPTQTMALLAGSPAIDAGDNATCAAAPVSNLDQRGSPRPLDGDNDTVIICDIGAYEAPEPSVTTITADGPDPSAPNQSVAVRVTVTGGSSTPTGTVGITGTDANCQITLSGGAGSCNVTFTSTGSKTITATYNGDATHTYSSDTAPHNVWLMMKFVSQPGNDGWVLESGENTTVGGSMNSTATTLRAGDDNQDRQYRSLLSFNTTGLPNTATIKKVLVYVKRQSVTGTNPLATHGGLRVDIRKPYFGAGPGLALNDFQAAANLGGACTIGATSTASGWHKCTTASGAFPYVNKLGTTQFRLRFATGDNDDMGADVLNLYSGNAISANRPYIIVWYLP